MEKYLLVYDCEIAESGSLKRCMDYLKKVKPKGDKYIHRLYKIEKEYAISDAFEKINKDKEEETKQ